LDLTFLDRWISVDKSDGEEVSRAAWSDLELSTGQRSELPGGRDGVVIVVVERGGLRRHQFVLPTDDPASTESSVQAHARAHRLRTNPPQRAVSRGLTIAVAVAAVATLTALLLSAEHVIDF
jgi:hypothetical protein